MTRTTKEYGVVTAADQPSRLVTVVNELIEKGWEPLGGVSTCMRDNGEMIFTQAMVR